MKQVLCILLSACILFSLGGCRSSGLHNGSATVATTVSTTATTIPEPTRQPHIQLEFFLEGMTEYQNATLFAGNGYSLYIPDDNWVMSSGENGEMAWTSGYNPDIVFKVIPNAGATYAQARNALFQGYTNLAEEGEYIYGHNEALQMFRAARLIETPNGILAAVWDYTLEAAEGFGVRLRVVAGTLEPTH
jgi:hypothetical protein